MNIITIKKLCVLACAHAYIHGIEGLAPLGVFSSPKLGGTGVMCTFAYRPKGFFDADGMEKYMRRRYM